MALSRKLTSLSVLALLAPLACADLIGLRPPKPDESGSGGLGGDGNQGTGAAPNGDGGNESGGAGPGTGGEIGSGSTGGASGGSGGSGDGGGDSGGGSSGGGSGGQPGIIEPTLITSGPDDFWIEGDVVEQGTTADVEVDTTERFQTWHGFGGAFTEAGWTALEQLSQQDRELAMRLLFSKTDGAGFVWGRLPIGASSHASSRYTLCDFCDESNLTTEFSIERDQQALVPFALAALEQNPDIKFFGIPWTPPPWMKENGASYDGGMMQNDPTILDAYADYFVEWIEAYEAEGILIDHVQPQNEPDLVGDYPSCSWGVDTPFLGDFVEEHLIPGLSSAGLDTKVWYGALSDYGEFASYWANLSATARGQVEGVSLQWGTLSHVSSVRLNTPDLLIMQAEHQCGNYPWSLNAAASKEAANSSTFWAAEAPNNYNYGVETWELLKDWIVEPSDGVNVYLANHLVLDTIGRGLDIMRPWPQNSLLAVNLGDDSLQVTPAYYVFRHMSQYVDVGAVLVRAQGGDAVAFENPDGSVVTILYNEEQNPAPTTLSIDGTLVEFTIPAGGWATVNWQE